MMNSRLKKIGVSDSFAALGMVTAAVGASLPEDSFRILLDRVERLQAVAVLNGDDIQVEIFDAFVQVLCDFREYDAPQGTGKSDDPVH